ncbi:MAG: VOC family protein [Sphingomonadaceae bacterium]|nr:VOC family protein [Sphingomonadaceae bacterium]
MKILGTSIPVEDQQQALDFYAGKLGFEKKHDIPLGEHRWLTITEAGDSDGVEIFLEPSEHPAVRVFKEALVKDGIPYTMFGVDNCEAEHKRLTGLGVEFTTPPTDVGSGVMAVFDDTCGNLIQIFEEK